MSRALALSLLLPVCAAAQAERDPALPPSAVPGKAAKGAAVPAPPGAVPELKGVPLAPQLKGPTEPEPSVVEEPGLLAAPAPVDAKLFSRLVEHVRKHCATDEESGLCCLSGQNPAKKKAPTRTACLEIDVPSEEGDIHHAVYREVLMGLTLVTAEVKAKPSAIEYTTLEMGMGGAVTQAEMETEASEGTQRRANPMGAGEAASLFDSAAKDLLTITPRVKT